MESFWPFDKPVWELESQDLHQLEGKEEGWQVEYKGGETLDDLGKKDHVPKSVAAFANHHGGWLFLGIETETTDDATNVPIVPVKGIAREAELAARVHRLISGNLSPAPMALVREIACPEDEGRCVVVIRVPESDDPPHMHTPTGRIYVRRADEKDPLDWVKDRHELERLYAKGAKAAASVRELMQMRDYGGRLAAEFRCRCKRGGMEANVIGPALVCVVAPLVCRPEWFARQVRDRRWCETSLLAFSEDMHSISARWIWQYGVSLASRHRFQALSVSTYGHIESAEYDPDGVTPLHDPMRSLRHVLSAAADGYRQAGYLGRLAVHVGLWDDGWIARAVRTETVDTIGDLPVKPISDELDAARRREDPSSALPPWWP